MRGQRGHDQSQWDSGGLSFPASARQQLWPQVSNPGPRTTPGCTPAPSPPPWETPPLPPLRSLPETVCDQLLSAEQHALLQAFGSAAEAVSEGRAACCGLAGPSCPQTD